MRNKIFINLAIMLLLLLFQAKAQNLLDMLDDETQSKEFVTATFKTTRVINGQSVMNPPSGELIFVISHRFGTLNSGPYELFGLDQSSIRLGFEYGLTDRLAIAVGRSSYLKNYDGFLKCKILKQAKGKGGSPVSLSWFSSISASSLKWSDPDRTNYFSSRLSYTHQLLLARKFSNALSLQISPTVVHRNLVVHNIDQNDVYALGFGGRIKLSQRVSINAEYFYLLPGTTADEYKNSFSLGFDLETGGHVFQLDFTNSLGMFESAFIPQTTGDWLKGGIHFGFNLTRVFTIRK